MSIATIEQAANSAGLLFMGASNPQEPHGLDDRSGTLVLLGTGRGFWPVFTRSDEYLDGQPHPVDRWSKRIVSGIARQFRASCSFPSDGPPYPPFISWALGTGRFHTSPVGMLVHDEVGLMISLRGALHFNEILSLPDTEQTSPCIDCPAPCSTACPVGALRQDSYDVKACRGCLDQPQGAACMTDGCAARLACPLSAGAGRTPAQSALHMKAFHPR